jgi:hypothetical protein
MEYYNGISYFKDKVCTILAGPINRDFQTEALMAGDPKRYPRNLMDHFFGQVVYIDSSSIVLQHPIFKTIAYYRLNNIVGIIEEQVSHDPEVKEQYVKMKEAAIEKPPIPDNNSQFVDIETMNKLAKEAKTRQDQ